MVYLDGAWANANDGKSRAWVEADKTTEGTIGGVRLVKYIVAFLFNLIYT